jgi:hypothetical protein
MNVWKKPVAPTKIELTVKKVNTSLDRTLTLFIISMAVEKNDKME